MENDKCLFIFFHKNLTQKLDQLKFDKYETLFQSNQTSIHTLANSHLKKEAKFAMIPSLSI